VSDRRAVSRWQRWNVRVAGGFGAILVLTGVSGLLRRDPDGLMSQAVPYDLFHLAFGALGVTLGLRRGPRPAAGFNLGFGLLDLYQVLAGLSGAFPAALFDLRPGDHAVHLLLGLVLVALGVAGLRGHRDQAPP
jgi:hypothetical protein